MDIKFELREINNAALPVSHIHRLSGLHNKQRTTSTQVINLIYRLKKVLVSTHTLIPPLVLSVSHPTLRVRQRFLSS